MSKKSNKSKKKINDFPKSEKIFNFFNLKHLKRKKNDKKNAMILVLPIEEISLRPKLQFTPFQNPGGYSERYRRKDGQTDEGWKSLCLI